LLKLVGLLPIVLSERHLASIFQAEEAHELQVREQRNGDISQHLKAVTLLEIVIRVSLNSDGAPAEAALEAFAQRLWPLQLTTYH
jgi:hypothetical protein